ncbi:hypothetical protein LPB90_19895 [Chryseobacterium sp. LC2016-29]|uniref:hypothetical protein n=1 Tax=Chryseobacterium sp. LC2016-29 TaxID=2897331 RepID=UPI001E2A9943|nr:hypothetical protein [Chryseobacterium sp. LC2016-29]MCD0480711.1 hypothetical protein [Chryseobacterium sp. LC2016-29]
MGTSTFVTNSQSEATLFFLNLPFGETMYEQTDGTYDNPVRYTDPDGMAQRIQVLKIDTINHLMSKKTFDNFIAYGKIKVDGNFLNKVIDDKN